MVPDAIHAQEGHETVRSIKNDRESVQRQRRTRHDATTPRRPNNTDIERPLKRLDDKRDFKTIQRNSIEALAVQCEVDTLSHPAVEPLE